MTITRTARAFGFLVAVGLAGPPASSGHEWRQPASAGSVVGVCVEVDGHPARLYPAPDGSSRHYLEAREGARYAVLLENRTGERVGVVLTVDGLNAITGTGDRGRGRMYVLDPWGRATIRGWRTSLRDVRRFTFVDETRSYATRTGQANSRMGWIEATVYRERRRVVRHPHVRQEWPERSSGSGDAGESESDAGREGASAAPSAPAQERPVETADVESSTAAKGRRSYPGTGWGPRAHDPVVLVSFDPEPSPAERVTLRYEYRGALVALGVLPHSRRSGGRLWERDGGEPGFAQPPLW